MKVCNVCGTQLKDEFNACPNCGNMNLNNNQINYQNQQPYNQGYQQVNNQYIQQQNYINNMYSGKTNSHAMIGFICSIISLFIFPFIAGMVAISCCASGYKQIKVTNEKGKGLAIAGIIIGIFSCIFAFTYKLWR